MPRARLHGPLSIYCIKANVTCMVASIFTRKEKGTKSNREEAMVDLTIKPDYVALAYQLVLLHGLIKINVNIKIIANNYNYLSHTLFHLLNVLTHTPKYIFIII